MSIRLRLFLISLGLLLVLGGMALISSRNTFELVRRQADQGEFSSCHNASASLRDWMERQENLLYTASRNMSYMIENLGILPGTMGDYVRDLTANARGTGFRDLYVALPNGKLMDGNFWFPEEGYDPREQEWYRRAAETKKVVLTPLHEDPKGGGLVLTLAVRNVEETAASSKEKILHADQQMGLLGREVGLVEGSVEALGEILSRRDGALEDIPGMAAPADASAELREETDRKAERSAKPFSGKLLRLGA